MDFFYQSQRNIWLGWDRHTTPRSAIGHATNCATEPIVAYGQSELPRPMPRNSVDLDHGCTSRSTLITRVIT